MIYFQTGRNLEIPEVDLLHFGAALPGPLEEGFQQGLRVAAPAGTPQDAQDFHSGLLEMIINNMEIAWLMSRRIVGAAA
jgi:hypothetical protein